jgi:hypothetical protein
MPGFEYHLLTSQKREKNNEMQSSRSVGTETTVAN